MQAFPLVAAALMLLCFMPAASASRYTRHEGHFSTRGLRQLPTEQCGCQLPEFSCAKQEVLCVPSIGITSPEDDAQCGNTIMQSSGCSASVPLDSGYMCPRGKESVNITVCAYGLKLANDPSDCQICHSIRFKGSCEVNDYMATTKITCTKDVTSSPPSGWVTINDFDCTAVNLADPLHPGKLYFYNNSALDIVPPAKGNTNPLAWLLPQPSNPNTQSKIEITKIKWDAFFDTNRCLYRISTKAPGTGCESHTKGFANVIIGNPSYPIANVPHLGAVTASTYNWGSMGMESFQNGCPRLWDEGKWGTYFYA